VSSTSQVAFEGQQIPKEASSSYRWPSGVLDLVNHPLRANGWNPWFSEWPNDVTHYEIKLRDTDDLNRIVKKLAAIDCERVHIQLRAGTEPRSLGFSTSLPKGNGIPAMFSIGSQGILDEWYSRLPETETGVRVFGVNRHTKKPMALPPTLPLYVGNDAIDLTKLTLPPRVESSADVSDAYRKEHRDDPVVKAIDAFIVAQKAAAKKD
jgi:hypothetical protein